MFIELVDALRCPRPHEESWLVVAAERLVARHIVAGTLGCPVCAAEYPIRDGIVDFSGGAARPVAAAIPPSAEQAVRLAALLALDDAQGFAVLLGEWGAHAIELRGLVECPLVLVDPPDDVEAAPGLSIIRTGGSLPIAAGSARGVAVDAGHPERVASAVTVTRSGGRVLAPAAAPLPAGLRELARDTAGWVAEREAAPSGLVTLRVRRSGTSEPPTPP